MNAIYILIMVISTGRGVATLSVEFNSLAACKAASDAVSKAAIGNHSDVDIAVCAAKAR